MHKFEFVQYVSQRYGIDDSVAETLLDMFSSSLQDLLSAGYSVNIDEIGEFKTTPLFPHGLNHQNNIALFKAAKRNMVSFKASDNLTNNASF